MALKGWRIVGLILLVVVVGLVGMVWLAIRQEARLLLDIARPVRSGNMLGHAWQSDKTLITITPEEKSWQVKTVNVAAGTEHDRFTETVAEGVTGLWSVSPDGQRLASVGYTNERYGSTGVDVHDLDGDQIYSLASYFASGSQSPPSVAWLPDNRRILTMQTNLGMSSIDTPDGSAISLPTPKGARVLLGVTPDMRLIATDHILLPGSNTSKIVITTVGLLPNTEAERQYTITLPSEMEVRELALSPSGDRLAWMLAFSRIHPLRRFLARIIPALAKNTRPERGTAIWVSRLDGHEMHQIGFQPAGTDKTANASPHDLHWKPDGKDLSFLYKDGVYTAPAD